MDMANMYYWIGFTFVFCSSATVFVYLVYKFYQFALNQLGKIFKHWWVIVEYSFYRHDFKEFMKDKKQIRGKQDLINLIEEDNEKFC